MSYRFISRGVDDLEREGQKRALMAKRAEAVQSRMPPDGLPPSPFPSPAPKLRNGLPAAAPKALPSPPPAAVIAYHRLGFGPRPGDIEAFNALGANDTERLTAWVDEQLDPSSIDDSAADARIAQSGFTTLNKSLTQLWEQHHLPDDIEWYERIQPFGETVLMTFLRAIYSRRQLQEVIVDFWHNHFNVYASDFLAGPLWVHTDRDAIRANAFGNFRTMIEAVTKTPAMLYYLNNDVNTLEDANENFAREFLELHTLGAAAYLGSMPESDVPRTNGVADGYVEETVIAAAKCLTGWTVDDRDWLGPTTGNFMYRDDEHDHTAKTVLGVNLPANQAPMKDGTDLFDLLAQHPATGRHIATKLARRILGDFPPASVVDAAAAVFTAQHAAPDQIAQTIRTIVLSPEFLTTWADKVKRPFEIAAGFFRGTGGDIPFVYQEDITNYFQWVYYQTGQPLFEWHPPNGYPDFKASWNSTAPRVMCWRVPNMLLSLRDETEQYYFDVQGVMPSDIRSANAIVDWWTTRMIGQVPPDAERAELVDLMAQGINPAYDLPLDTDEEVQSRLRALVAVIAMSPSYLFR